MHEPARPLLIFDGDCGFCTWAARWAARGWGAEPKAVSWQRLGDTGLRDVGLTIDQAEQAAWWVDESSRLVGGHRAIGRALLAGGAARRVAGWVIVSAPFSGFAAAVYRLVVRSRHHLPGATACRVPSGPS